MNNFDQLPDAAFLRESQLVLNPKHPERITVLPFSAPTLWRGVKDGTIPKPVKLSAGVTAWRVGDIRQWLAAKGATK
jgi:prophage regulatory protein